VRFIDEYRDAGPARQYERLIAAATTRPWNIMEVCGGQTHAILKFGVDELLPTGIRLLHGPGCPVCVTPLELVDKAIEIASDPSVIFTSFGDMLRVPGSETDLLKVKAGGGDVRIVYSPLDALKLARAHPDRQVVFFAVGFETTAPANAMAVHQAWLGGVGNFSILVSHVLVPPAIEALLSSPDNRIDAFLAPGHVCAIAGFEEYERLVQKHRVPMVVTGFEPLDILQGVHMCVTQLEAGRYELENQYVRAVARNGNLPAQETVREVFLVVSRKWRGVGEIAQSGLALRPKYHNFDAERRFGLSKRVVEEPAECKSGLVLQGNLRPDECSAFGTRCTPDHPLGATMVSSEGACAAYYRYRTRPSTSGETRESAVASGQRS
jgi:hydrogenase expression/formation protein HypD